MADKYLDALLQGNQEVKVEDVDVNDNDPYLNQLMNSNVNVEVDATDVNNDPFFKSLTGEPSQGVVKPTSTLPISKDYKPKGDDKYQKKEGFLLKALEPLDYLGNISRSGILAYQESDNDFLKRLYEYTSQAAKRERYTSEEKVWKNIGYDRLSQREGLDWGDVPDFVMDVGLGIATDPLTWLSFGTTALGKSLGKKIGKHVSAGKSGIKSATKLNVAEAMQKIEQQAKGMKFADDAEREAWKLAQAEQVKTMTETSLKKDLLKEAGKIQAGSELTVPLLGGMYGTVALTDEDSDLVDYLNAFGAGAAVATTGKVLAPKAKQKLTKITDAAYDLYAKGSRDAPSIPGINFDNMSAKMETMKTGSQRAKDIMENTIIRGREEVLKDLTPAERVMATRYMTAMTDMVVDARKRGGITQRKDAIQQGVTRKELKADADSYERLRALDEETYAFIDANNIAEKTMDAMKLNDKTKKAVNEWQEFNKRIIGEYNTRTNSDVLAIRYHYPKIFSSKDMADMADHFDDMKKLNGKFVAETPEYKKLKARLSLRSSTLAEELRNTYKAQLQRGDTVMVMDRGKMRPVQIGEEGLDDILLSKAYDNIYGEYAQGMAYGFLDKAEREAMRTVKEFRNSAKGGWKSWEKFWKGYDTLNNMTKAQLLQASETWLRNTYFDNIMKAHMETGIIGAFKASWAGVSEVGDVGTDILTKLNRGVGESIQEFQSGLKRDMNSVLNGKPVAFDTLEGKQIAKYRVLDGEAMTALKDDSLDQLMFNPFRSEDEIKAIIKGENGVDPTKDIFDKFRDSTAYKTYYDNMLGKVGKVGRRLEAKARVATWKAHKKSLMRNGLSDEEAAEVAADLTTRAFFDYGDVTAFEKAVMKRMLPFYSFYSKNLPYWVDAMFDPVKLSRMAQADRLRQNVGGTGTPAQEEGMPNYLEKSAAQVVGRGKSGGTKYAYLPGMSYLDAFKMSAPLLQGDLTQGLNLGMDYLSPLIKTPLELATGHDFFTDDKLYPSDLPSGKKYLYASGHKYTDQPTDMLPFNLYSGIVENIPGGGPVMLDKSGNPYTMSDSAVIAHKIIDPLLPVIGAPIVNQILGSIGKVQAGKETPSEALINLFSPIRTTEVSSRSIKYTREKKREEAKKERKKEANKKRLTDQELQRRLKSVGK